ncbi:MAG: 30S ribosomal protein S27ae [Candidatus Hodarchaeales archaeon]|jgi:small subunit ribosomal protein S27Ae
MPVRRKAVHEYYDLDYKKGSLKRLRKFCPRCKGSFMAKHEGRVSCGLCGYSEF